MDTYSKLLFALLVVAVLVSVFATYRSTIVKKDFVIINDLEEETALEH